ncbi:unnamed protein product, partial [Brassica oleracea]
VCGLCFERTKFTVRAPVSQSAYASPGSETENPRG